MLTYNATFSKIDGQVIWRGKSVEEQGEFSAFLAGPTRSRLFDEQQYTRYEADLRALATTEMASNTITRLLASQPDKAPWEVGEALAECFLEEERGVKFPWNTERDKRTPKASLPGADLVGFIEEGDEAVLVLGEVKTSSDANSPPLVMYGKSGLIHQLDNLAADNLDSQLFAEMVASEM
ncbi:MAG: hypothetical protein P4L43_14540 [Syntrophobacteraceae bacterium]|nr:hypothetical protein [Syntrophobacteraceae bacterium]